MARWDNGNLTVCNGAKHEIMMELPHIREQFYAKTAQLFEAHSDKA
jgi:alpha-beta hydrolase superfamily lysophospholipase